MSAPALNYWSTWPSTDTSWTNNVRPAFHLLTAEQPPWWVDNIGRDRINLARARFFYATPYRGPRRTSTVRCNYSVRCKFSRSSWRPRWQRSPLHKRALARR